MNTINDYLVEALRKLHAAYMAMPYAGEVLTLHEAGKGKVDVCGQVKVHATFASIPKAQDALETAGFVKVDEAGHRWKAQP